MDVFVEESHFANGSGDGVFLMGLLRQLGLEKTR